MGAEQVSAAGEEVGRTWDGLPIASDRPTGSAVVVRRRRGDRTEVLLLHRAAEGPEYEGDWAWTAPAGCRQPGESVCPAAVRELAEEAGISGPPPWAVDLSGRWALFAVDLPEGVDPRLVDPEHDRFIWSDAEKPSAAVLPDFVAAQQRAAAFAAPVGGLAFRRMREPDLDLMVAWRQSPHVAAWWGERPSAAKVRAHYGPHLSGDQPVRMWIVEADHEPIGFVQDYLVSSDDEYAAKTGDPDAVGIDYAIGEPGWTGQGVGTRMIWEFCRDVARRGYPDARHVVASPSHRNQASLRTLAKCGFERGRWIDPPAGPGEPTDTEIVCTLDLDHWLG